MFKRSLSLFVIIIFFTQCSTTVRITSDPAGAQVYINEKSVGKTPIEISKSDFVFTSYRIRLTLEGYRTIYSELDKEFKPCACAGGLLLIFPFLWVSGPKEVQHFVLER